MPGLKFPPLPPHPPTQKQLAELREQRRLMPKIGYALNVSQEEKQRYAALLDEYLAPYESQDAPENQRGA